ncbi:TPA: prepilin peptidase [Salmonella enterica subsp. enterica serovar Concord]|nr:prepilin peptidase [Salmonella enterica subsp. enterica serovar Concord]
MFFVYFYLAMSTLMGLCVGSFMNVVIYRLPLMISGEGGGSLSWPPSHCPVCHSRIRWYDNIPVFSWLFLRGRCRDCHTRVSPVYLLTEAVTGLWFVAVWLFTVGVSPASVPVMTLTTAAHLLPPLVLFCFLYCITFIDIRHYLIPDGLSLGLLWSGLVFSVCGLIPVTPFYAVTGVVLAWGVLLVVQTSYRFIRGHDGLGGGDVKLFAAAGAWLGLMQVPWLIVASALCGGVLYAVRWCYLRRQPDDRPVSAGLQAIQQETGLCRVYIPFGPAIVMAMLGLFFVPGL